MFLVPQQGKRLNTNNPDSSHLKFPNKTQVSNEEEKLIVLLPSQKIIK